MASCTSEKDTTNSLVGGNRERINANEEPQDYFNDPWNSRILVLVADAMGGSGRDLIVGDDENSDAADTIAGSDGDDTIGNAWDDSGGAVTGVLESGEMAADGTTNDVISGDDGIDDTLSACDGGDIDEDLQDDFNASADGFEWIDNILDYV